MVLLKIYELNQSMNDGDGGRKESSEPHRFEIHDFDSSRANQSEFASLELQ